MTEMEITDKVLKGQAEAFRRAPESDLRWEEAKKRGLTWKDFTEKERSAPVRRTRGRYRN